MSSTDTTTKRSAASRDTLLDTYELADQITRIREELQSLTSTVGRIAGKQLGRTQDTVRETANQVDTAIRQNPLSALAIAAALGFLIGVFTRR
jgi:ElaB/YqjD/DUF883 family membrane-anchored ribosome-binding protein